MKYFILPILIGISLCISRAVVHDPAIIEDNGQYYVFGSHLAVAKSDNLISWTHISNTDYEDPITNPVFGNLQETFKESFKWAGYDDGDTSGGKYAVWAPDPFYNPDYIWTDGSKGAYMLYYATSSTWRRSCIGFLISKRVDGDYIYGDTIVYSGFSNTGSIYYDGNSKRDTTWDNDYLHLKKLMNDGVLDNNLKTWKCFANDGTWNAAYAPNAIDQTIFYDSEKNKLYMVYGSWSGGIFVLELDKTTGKPIYPGKDGVDEISQNYVDRYFGIHIAGGNHMSGEGGYIRYDKASGYYIFYETYGWLAATGGYNMRLFRSKNVQGPYVDPAGNQAQFNSVDGYKYGVKLIGNYQFDLQPGYRSAGHNSALITDDGKYFLIYHQRFLDEEMGENYEVRVHQQFLNEDKWLVTAVYEYKNEKIRKHTINEVIGSYEYINHGNVVQDGSMLKTGKITLDSKGLVSGDETGTWKMFDGDDYTYVTFTLSNVEYKGVFYIQSDDNNGPKMTFTAIGSNNIAIWGSSKFIINKDRLKNDF